MEIIALYHLTLDIRHHTSGSNRKLHSCKIRAPNRNLAQAVHREADDPFGIFPCNKSAMEHLYYQNVKKEIYKDFLFSSHRLLGIKSLVRRVSRLEV